MSDYAPLVFFVFLGALVAGGAMITASLLAYKSKDSQHKHLAYECGVDLFGDARIQFKVSYYLYALLFMVFDIESLFLFPVVRVFRQVIQGKYASISSALIVLDLSVFILVLVAGLVYAWRKGALQWD